MFSRIYFVLVALSMLSPINKLYSKRLCIEHGFMPDYRFLVRANMIKHPYITMSSFSITAVVTFAALIRVFERPYYAFMFDLPMYDFD